MTSTPWPTPSSATCDALHSLAWRHRMLAPRRAPPHDLVLRSAKNRDKAGFLVREGRLGSWANTTRIFHMTHIAKTGGRSVRLELLRLVRPVGGAEQCYPPFAHESRINIIFFREPRGHALSQYLHGAYAGRTKLRRAAGYPRVDGDDLAGFGQWVHHFADGWTPARGDFFGYNPLNMMARTLTCRDERWNCDYLKECDLPCAHHVGRRAADATPPLAESPPARTKPEAHDANPRHTCTPTRAHRRARSDERAPSADEATPRHRAQIHARTPRSTH